MMVVFKAIAKKVILTPITILKLRKASKIANMKVTKTISTERRSFSIVSLPKTNLITTRSLTNGQEKMASATIAISSHKSSNIFVVQSKICKRTIKGIQKASKISKRKKY